MIKKTKKMIKPEIGKYYINNDCVMKVTHLNTTEEGTKIMGILIIISDEAMSVSMDAYIGYILRGGYTQEITREEFEQKLYEAQAAFINMFNEIRLSNDEKNN